MIMWLDHFIFGNGNGVGAPFWDQKYYWLVDTHNKELGVSANTVDSARNGRTWQHVAFQRIR